MKSLTIRNTILVMFVVLTIILVLSNEAVLAQAKTYELRVATYVPPISHIGQTVGWWTAELGKRTGGRVKATAYYSEILGKGPDFLNMLNSGTANVTVYPAVAIPGRFPITELVTDTPMLRGIMKAEEELMNRLLSAGMLKEYDGLKVMSWFPIDPMLLFTNKKVTTLEDLKGLKIRARGRASSLLSERLGTVPVSLEVGELYMALERGSVDGVLTCMSAYMPFKLNEICNYTLDEPLLGGMPPMLMSGRTWNSLPQDIQVTIEQLNKELSTVFYNKSMEVVKVAYGVASQGKRQITKLSPAEGTKLQNVLDSVTGEFVEKANAIGLPGAEVQRKGNEVMKLWNSGKLK